MVNGLTPVAVRKTYSPHNERVEDAFLEPKVGTIIRDRTEGRELPVKEIRPTTLSLFVSKGDA